MKNKKGLATMACVIFVVLLSAPSISNLYYERTRYIETSIYNVYEIDFKSHWNQVADVLKLNDNSMKNVTVEDLNIDYKKTGELKRLSYKLIWIEKESLRSAYVFYNDGLKMVKVNVRKMARWTPNDRIINADRLFSKLNEISIQDMTVQEDFPYYSLVFRGRVNFSINDEETFIIDDNQVVPFNGELPIDCYWINTFGMTQTGEGCYSSTQSKHFLFDVRY